MAGYVGTKAVLLSTTAANVGGDADIGGDLTVGGAFTSQGIDDNATSTAMTLDASGNVGINGTPSASDGAFKLIQIGGLNKYATFGAQANGAFAALMGSNFYYNGGWKRTDAGRATKIETGPDSSSEELFSFQYAGDGAADSAISWSEAMRIDSAGRVTTPNQPAFTAQPTSFTGSGGIAGTPTFIFATALLNIGGHFNTSNGRFTAPVAGNYFFTYSITASSSSKSARYFRVRLAKNGTTVLNPHNAISDETGNADYNIISASGLVAMNANDYVELNYGSSIDASGLVFYDNMNTFSGFLMS